MRHHETDENPAPPILEFPAALARALRKTAWRRKPK
jgi:hypothetical protein